MTIANYLVSYEIVLYDYSVGLRYVKKFIPVIGTKVSTKYKLNTILTKKAAIVAIAASYRLAIKSQQLLASQLKAKEAVQH